MAPESALSQVVLPPLVAPGGARSTLKEYRDRAERSYIVDTLRTLGLVASFAVALVFLTGMALNVSQSRLADAKLKARAHRIVRLQEEERAQVSRNLHDGISQLLVAAKLQIESAERTLDDQDCAKYLGRVERAVAELGGERRKD